MTSPRQSHGKPIEFVVLKINFKADSETAARIKQAVPEAVLKSGGCEVRVEGEQPGEVADKAYGILEKIRTVTDAPKGFK